MSQPFSILALRHALLAALAFGALLTAPTLPLRAQSIAVTADPNTGTLRSPLSLWQANAGEIATALSLGDYFVPPSRTLTAGAGLTGGGNLSDNRTISLANTSVTANTYGGASQAVSFTVDDKGRLTSAANQTITPVGIGALANSGNQTLNGSLTVNAGGVLGGNWTYQGAPMVMGRTFPGQEGWAARALNAEYAQNATGATKLGFADTYLTYNSGVWSGKLSELAAALDSARAKYATFNIPLGENFTDFELKASTSNFKDGMAFFYHSPDPGKSAVPEQIWTTRPDVYFTDSAYVGTDTDQNQRTWRKQSASQSIATMRAAGTNSVIAGAVVVVRDTGTLNPGNTALVWSYCRYTPTAYEADGAGRSIWMPITPQWVTTPPAPTAAVP